MRDKLKKIRLEHNLTQEMVADKAKIKRSTYTNIELGNADPSFKTAVAIKKALNYEGDDIFFTNNVNKRNKNSA